MGTLYQLGQRVISSRSAMGSAWIVYRLDMDFTSKKSGKMGWPLAIAHGFSIAVLFCWRVKMNQKPYQQSLLQQFHFTHCATSLNTRWLTWSSSESICGPVKASFDLDLRNNLNEAAIRSRFGDPVIAIPNPQPGQRGLGRGSAHSAQDGLSRKVAEATWVPCTLVLVAVSASAFNPRFLLGPPPKKILKRYIEWSFLNLNYSSKTREGPLLGVARFLTHDAFKTCISWFFFFF